MLNWDRKHVARNVKHSGEQLKIQRIAHTASAIVLTIVATTFANAESLESWQLPDPAAMIEASSALCRPQAQSMLEAVYLRDKGHKLDEVLALIPESPKAFTLRLVTAMRENVEDAFQYPNLSTYTLYSFRSEVCFRENLGAVRMPRLSSMEPKITECQKQHGSEKSTLLLKCIQGVVRETSPVK